jgi:HlyD family secretion protein
MRLNYFLHVISLGVLSIFLSACQQKTTPLQGYVDADYTYLSSNFSGSLAQLLVARGNQVTKGQSLFVLDAQPEEAQLQSAQARANQAADQLKQQQADLDYQTTLFNRYQKLLKTGGVSHEEFDTVQNNYRNAQAALSSFEANMRALKAELAQAQWTKSTKVVTAPVSGYIYDTYYTVGEIVPAEHSVLSLLTPDNLKIVFFAPEPLLSNLRLNQQVKITCDGCRKAIPATINYISSQAEYNPPNIYSEDTRTKLIYRIEASPIATAFLQLHPGQPVSVNLH